jgi:hypothetical protein
MRRIGVPIWAGPLFRFVVLASAILLVGGPLNVLDDGAPALAEPSTPTAVLVSDTVSREPGSTGEVFFDHTYRIETSDRNVVLAGAGDGTGEFSVDDVMEITVTRPDGSTSLAVHDFSDGCSTGSVGGLAPFSLADLLRPGANQVRIVLRDGCGGGHTGTTPLWMVGDFIDNVCVEGVPGQWAFRSYVSEDDGLVLGMARLGPRLAVRAAQVPSFTVRTESDGGDSEFTGELTPAPRGDDAGRLSSTLVGSKFNCEDREVAATYEVAGLPPELHLTVEQKYIFADRDGERCEPRGEIHCARFWPNVHWRLTDDNPDGGAKLVDVEINQRIDLKPDDMPLGSGEVIWDKFNPSKHPGLVPLGLSDEEEVHAIPDPGGRRTCRLKPYFFKGCWDNYHQTGGHHVALPGVLGSPGCPECVHTHWHWSTLTNVDAEKAAEVARKLGLPAGGGTAAVDALFADFTDGDYAILSGSPQSARLAVVAEDGETDPPDGASSLLNDEPLAGRHPIMYWKSRSKGIKQGDRERVDATFPPLRGDDVKPGDRGGMWFAPANTTLTDEIAECAPVVSPPDWDADQNTFAGRGLPAGWVVEVTVAVGGCSSRGATGSAPHGPYYLVADEAGGRLVNPDWSYEQAPIGDGYRAVRDDDGTPTTTDDGSPRVSRTVYLVFPEKPDPQKVNLRLLYGPGDGTGEPYGG